MGWLWSSSTPAPADSKSEPQHPTPTSITVRPASDTSPPPSQSQPQPQSQNDAAFHAVHPHLSPSEPISARQPSSEPAYDPSLPTTMSCRAAFDSAFYCSSFGGHFNDIYRYGQLRSCSEHWADWRFCMSLRMASAEGKARAIQERYREKEKRLLGGPNSEQVWRKRGPGEEVRDAFGRAEEEARRVEDA